MEINEEKSNSEEIPYEIQIRDSNAGKVPTLAEQVDCLLMEKKKTEEEFGLQRAKMKDLYLQKEVEFKQQLEEQECKSYALTKQLQTELDDCRSQLTALTLELQWKQQESQKYQEELFSLQQFINETVDENTRYENENKRLLNINTKLRLELNERKTNISGNVSSGGNNSSSGPLGTDIPPILSVPGTVISTLARKVTNQLTTQLASTPVDSNYSNTAAVEIFSQISDSDTLDDSMRKAQEDAAVLRSLVVPLEEEIRALKDKLREMDAELRKYQNDTDILNDQVPETNEARNVVVRKIIDFDDDSDLIASKITSNSSTNSSGVTSGTTVDYPSPIASSSSCDSCANHVSQLLNAQQKIHDLEKHIVSLERYKQELSKETAFRKDMEVKWNEKKEEYKEQVSALQSKTLKAEETLHDLRSTFTSTCEDMTAQLKQLCLDRENNQKELNKLQRENENLMGKYSKHSQQLQNEAINLPDNVDDLQEMNLRYLQELIAAKIAKEVADETVMALKEEIEVLRQHSQSEEQTRIELESQLTESMNKLRDDIHPNISEKGALIEGFQGVGRDNSTLKEDLKQYGSKIEKLAKSKKELEDIVKELRSRVASLQNELDNSEKVQKDFVLLSQSLQQELEKIRSSENEVRWEHELDVTECRQCKKNFSATKKRKMHCRHCGRVFCDTCLTHEVNSGPNNRPSKVCEVCHTLLVPDSAPYFSTVPPQGD